MSLYWAKNRNMIPTMIRAIPIATDAEPLLLPAAIRFLPATVKLFLLCRRSMMRLSPHQVSSIHQHAALFLLEDVPVFHHEGCILESVDVGKRIALNGDDVGKGAWRDHANIA